MLIAVILEHFLRTKLIGQRVQINMIEAQFLSPLLKPVQHQLTIAALLIVRVNPEPFYLGGLLIDHFQAAHRVKDPVFPCSKEEITPPLQVMVIDMKNIVIMLMSRLNTCGGNDE
jgi:hypothetical protein